MTAVVFDGEKFARAREKKLAKRIKKLGITPKLVAVVFAEDKASQIYARLKGEAAERVGIKFGRLDFSLKDDPVKIVEAIKHARAQEDVTGWIAQKPATVALSQRVAEGEIPINDINGWWENLTDAIDPEKDADCLNKKNLDRVYGGEWKVLPATVKAVLSVLQVAIESRPGLHQGLALEDLGELEGKRVAVVGLSAIFGQPFAAVAEQLGATVTKLDIYSTNIEEETKTADILVSATGRPRLIKKDMVKQGAIVIDVGEPKGDVDFEEVKDVVAFITPVPGGVGPMTVVSLLENIVEGQQHAR